MRSTTMCVLLMAAVAVVLVAGVYDEDTFPDSEGSVPGTYSVTYDLENVSAVSPVYRTSASEPLVLEFDVADGYHVISVDVTMCGNDLEENYDYTTDTLTINCVCGDVAISIIATDSPVAMESEQAPGIPWNYVFAALILLIIAGIAYYRFKNTKYPVF